MAVHSDLLALASVAVKVTVVVPSGKGSGASPVMVGLASTTSVAEAPPRTAAMAAPLSA